MSFPDRSSVLSRAGIALHLGALLALLCPPTAEAEPRRANPARPTFSSPATPIVTGSLQIEAGYQLIRSKPDTTVHLSPLTLRLAAAKWFEARVYWDGVGELRPGDGTGKTGVGDFGLGAAFYFQDDTRWIPAIGALLTATLPVGTDGLGATFTRIETRLLVDKSIGRSFGVGLNAGLAALVPEGSGDTDVRLPLAATVVGHLFDLVDVFGEIYGEFDIREPASDANFAARAGLMVWAIDELAIDLAVDFGVTEPAQTVGFQLGFTWNIAQIF